MDLYLIRHAGAHERDPDQWPDDSERPLTPEGEEQFRVAAHGLDQLVSPVDWLLSSPYARAWRTAEVLAELDRWPVPEEMVALEPTLPPDKTAIALEAYEGARSLALVGHRPGLHELASYLLTGTAEGMEINIKKGGALCIRFAGAIEPGAGELRWALAPKALRALGS